MRYWITIAILLLPVALTAQLSAPGSNAVRYISYPSSPSASDPVFVFCNSSGNVKGALTAVSPGGTGPFSFTWYRWNDISRGFTDLLRTESGVMSSSLGELEEGGYRVNISNGSGYSTTMTGWVFLDKPFSFARLQNFTCDYVALNGRVAVDTFYYNDPLNGQRIRLNNGVKFRWYSIPESAIPYPEIELNPQTFSPPVEDVTYVLEVTDSMTCRNESSFFYESIHVKADFTAEPSSGEAPLDVVFTDKSVRASTYLWEFGDDSLSMLSNPVSHRYYIPGEYSVLLTVESDRHCVDSMRLNYIVVEESALDIPNVFTPNGDGLNDVFMVDKRSLKTISVDIFSRSGLRVYSFYGEGDMVKAWNGWDGYVNNSSFKASPGIYFYIIRARGWDDIKYEGKEYRGFVYLYR